MSRPVYFSGPPETELICWTNISSRCATPAASSAYLPPRVKSTFGSVAALRTKAWTTALTAGSPPSRAQSEVRATWGITLERTLSRTARSAKARCS